MSPRIHNLIMKKFIYKQKINIIGGAGNEKIKKFNNPL